MDRARLNENGTQGIKGDDHGFTGTESGYVMSNFVEGSSSSSAPMDDEMMHDSKLGIDHQDVNSKTDISLNNGGIGSPASSQNSANATLSDSSPPNIINPAFYIQRASDLLIVVSLCAESTRSKISDLAYSAMDELSKIGIAGKPLWQPPKDYKFETINGIEYLKQFCNVEDTVREIVKLVEVGEPRYLPSFDSFQIEYVPKPKANPTEYLKFEASRDMEYIKMNPINLVELLMDVNQWSRTFYNIVSRTAFLGILSNGVEGSYDGRLQVVSAEFHLPTPLVVTRECYFARYCKKLSPDMWGVADVSLEKVFPYPTTNFRRKPSGCLIKEMANGYSKVIWVEHVEADYSQLKIQFQPLVSSGFAFSATRWLASIVRSIECSETLKARTTPTVDGVLIPQAGRTSLLNLADRMMRSFCADISASTENPWMQVASLFSGSEDLRVMIKNTTGDTGRPRGTIVVFATSVWFPASPKQLFNFLRDQNSRNQWDLLSRGLSIGELAYVIQGKDPRNRISIMQVKTGKDRLGTFYLQESYTDSTGSYVIYAPVEKLPLSILLNGGNPDNVAIMPSGFAILPDGMSGDDGDAGTGSLLTIAYHIIESGTNRLLIPHELVASFNKIMAETVMALKDAVLNS